MGHSVLEIRRFAIFDDGDLLVVIALAFEACANNPVYAGVLEVWRQQADQGPGCIDLHLESKSPDDLRLVDRLLEEVERLVEARSTGIPAEVLNRWIPKRTIQFFDQDGDRVMQIVDRLRRFVREGIDPTFAGFSQAR